jgi:phosphoserine phosphatase
MTEKPQLTVSLDDQTLRIVGADGAWTEFPVSTAAKGMGFQDGSHRTPTGQFRICAKIGHGMPTGTIFRARVPCGTWGGCGSRKDLILSRILWLEGLDEENQNTRDRFIYIHGTNQEELIGHPASDGCIRMRNADVIRLFDMVGEGDRVEILPATRKRGKLCFIDCDSTLSSIEGIDELGRAAGPEIFAEVEALTHAAMNGDLPIAEVFPRRMDMIRPDRVLCERIGQRYVETMVEGADAFISELLAGGWTPVVLSGGFAPLIEPLARALGIRHVEAVPLYFHENGSYAAYGRDYPTTRNLGKNEVIREWKAALLPERVIMMGDGVSDLETKPDVDLFIGFGGVVERTKVREGAGHWLSDMRQRDGLWRALGRESDYLAGMSRNSSGSSEMI